MNYISVKELPTILEEIKDNKFIITSNHVNELTHVFHKYPAKFIPHIPRWAIKYTNKKNILVIDPFCGSGTTNLEAFLNGQKSIGFDIDPLALLISKVKTTPINPEKIKKSYAKLLRNIKDFNDKEVLVYPTINDLNHWFNQDAQFKIAFLKKHILENTNKDLLDFWLITLSSIIREVSNADNQSQKTYVSHTLNKISPEVFSTFKKRSILYIERMSELWNKTAKSLDNKPSFYMVDTRESIKDRVDSLDKTMFRVAITSPPYIKAIDYIYNQMLEYFWLGDILGIEGKNKMNEYKRRYIGTKQVYSNEYNEYKYIHFGIKELDETIRELMSINKKHAYITQKYFESMKQNLLNINSILRKGELYFVVVGNTSVSGIKIPTDKYISIIGESLGYKLHTIFSYKIRNRFMRFDRKGRGGLVEDDNIIILEKA